MCVVDDCIAIICKRNAYAHAPATHAPSKQTTRVRTITLFFSSNCKFFVLYLFSMEKYTIQEKVDMVGWHYAAHSLQQICDLFSVKYQDRPIPSKSTVQRIIKKFTETGSVQNKENRAFPTRETSENMKVAICASIEANENQSIRDIAKSLDMPFTTVHKVLKQNGYKSFKVAKHQELPQYTDKFRRMEFCEQVMEAANNGNNFIGNILFSDESTFPLRGKHNSGVVRYWSKENKFKSIATRTQYPQSLNVWAGILGTHIIGPFFINNTLNGNRYLQLLENQILPALMQLPNINIQDIYFQQDGCPAHNTLIVRHYLNQHFPERWIGTHSHPISWPPRSPDLTPLDFFYWGYLKNSIYGYENRPNNLDELRVKINEVSHAIPADMLLNVQRSFYDRMGYCLAQEGGIFENLL